jgi:hypothetical protein
MQAKPPIAGGRISEPLSFSLAPTEARKKPRRNWQGRTGRILHGGVAVLVLRGNGGRVRRFARGSHALGQTATVRLQRFHRVP